MSADAAAPPFLEGERCYLRPLARSDLDGNWRNWLNDPEVTSFMFHGTFPTTADSNAEFYEQVSRSSSDLVLAVAAKDDGEHVGNVGLHRIDWVNRSAEFGILIGERGRWGQGIGTEAARLIVGHGFDRLNLHRIWLGVFAAHTAAIEVYERIGFRIEGTLREAVARGGAYEDQLLMGLLEHDFRSS